MTRTAALFLFLLVLAGLFFTACNVGTTTLNHQTISRQTTTSDNLDGNPRLNIITQTPSYVAGISDEDQSLLTGIDYSRNMVIIVFLGFNSESRSGVTRVTQFKSFTGQSSIWLRSDLPPSSSGDNKSVDYQIIQLTKSEMVDFGDITFRLLDAELRDKSSMHAYVLAS